MGWGGVGWGGVVGSPLWKCMHVGYRILNTYLLYIYVYMYIIYVSQKCLLHIFETTKSAWSEKQSKMAAGFCPELSS